MQRIIAFWNKGWMAKALLSIVGLLLVCCVFGIFAPRSKPIALNGATVIPTYNDFPPRPNTDTPATAEPTDAPATVEPTDAPTAEVLARLSTDVPASPTAITAPKPTAKPTAKPASTAATATPKPVAPAPAASGDSYPCKPGQIKGNRNSKKYHSPGQRDYAKTQANVQCFDTAEQAEAAGYVAAKQ